MTVRQFVLLVVIALAVSITMAMIASGAECQVVTASYYGAESGSRTANGEHFTGNDLTAAMPSRKFLGRTYRVTYAGKSVVVRINDVGPARRTGRGIDLARAAAAKIGMIRAGVASVCIERL